MNMSEAQQKALYAERLKSYKQLELEIKLFQDEMNKQFRTQQAEVTKLESENKALSSELLTVDTHLKQQVKAHQKDNQQGAAFLKEIQALKDKYEREVALGQQLDEQHH